MASLCKAYAFCPLKVDIWLSPGPISVKVNEQARCLQVRGDKGDLGARGNTFAYLNFAFSFAHHHPTYPRESMRAPSMFFGPNNPLRPYFFVVRYCSLKSGKT